MASVHRALDPARREVAVKLMDPAAASERFAQEAVAAARLDHPGIVRVYSHGRDALGRDYLVMELVEGGSLRERMARTGPLPQTEAVALVRELCQALAHAHARGVVHRDLKPHNVLLTPEGQPKLADFGLARDLLAPQGQRLTRTAEIMGTPGYMAPEQVEQARTADARADVYGLGAILFALVTGRPPFPGDNVISLLNAVLHQPAPSPRTLRPDLDPRLEAVILRCLEKRPDQRPPSAAALDQELTAWETARSDSPRRSLLAALSGAGLLTLLLAGWSLRAPHTAAGAASSQVPATTVGLARPDSRQVPSPAQPPDPRPPEDGRAQRLRARCDALTSSSPIPADLEQYEGQFQEASHLFREALDLPPGPVQALLYADLVRFLEGRGRPHLALKLLEEAGPRIEGDLIVAARGVLRACQRGPETALDDLAKGALFHLTSVEHPAWALTDRHLAEPTLAAIEERLRTGRAGAPLRELGLRALAAELAWNTGDQDRALELLEGGVGLTERDDPREPHLVYRFRCSRRWYTRTPDGESHRRAAGHASWIVTRFPTRAVGYDLRAFARKQGMFEREEACQDFARAVELAGPAQDQGELLAQHADLRMLLGYDAEGAGQKDTAITHYEQALRLMEQAAQQGLGRPIQRERLRARALACLGRPREALAVYERCLTLDPTEQERQELYCDLAWASQGAGAKEESRRWAHRLQTEFPGSVFLRTVEKFLRD